MKMDVKKIILDKYPSYSGKTKFIKAIFLINFVDVPPQELEKKRFNEYILLKTSPSSRNVNLALHIVGYCKFNCVAV
jgi:hypothetical protein